MIRIMIVDDHPVVRSGIVGMIETDPELQVVAEASDGEQSLAALESIGADVILTDLRMPGVDGVELTRRALALAAPPRVVVLTTYDTDADILRAVEAGALGYLLKDAPREQIIQAVKAAAAGEAALSPKVAARLVAYMHGGPTVSLTAREVEVLTLVSEGRTNQQVAGRLGITIATVKTHLERTYEKLGTPDRASAVAKAMSLGLLGPG